MEKSNFCHKCKTYVIGDYCNICKKNVNELPENIFNSDSAYGDIFGTMFGDVFKGKDDNGNT